MIEFHCDGCGYSKSVDKKLLGRKVLCPKCKEAKRIVRVENAQKVVTVENRYSWLTISLLSLVLLLVGSILGGLVAGYSKSLEISGLQTKVADLQAIAADLQATNKLNTLKLSVSKSNCESLTNTVNQLKSENAKLVPEIEPQFAEEEGKDGFKQQALEFVDAVFVAASEFTFAVPINESSKRAIEIENDISKLFKSLPPVPDDFKNRAYVKKQLKTLVVKIAELTAKRKSQEKYFDLFAEKIGDRDPSDYSAGLRKAKLKVADLASAQRKEIVVDARGLVAECEAFRKVLSR